MDARMDKFGIADARTHDRHWRRTGWRRAWCASLALVAALAVVGRIAPPEEPATVRRTPHWTWVLPGDASLPTLPDVLAVRSPAAFAMPSPAGFTGSLRTRTPRLAPPVRRMVPPSPRTFPAHAAAAPDWASPELAPRVPVTPGARGWTPVFAHRNVPEEVSRMEFPPGWEQRLFSGLDLAYDAWAPSGEVWGASAELEFNAQGIPVSVILDRPSGMPEVDRRIARSAAGWRLLEPAAPRRGKVVWRVVPAAADPDAAATATEEAP